MLETYIFYKNRIENCKDKKEVAEMLPNVDLDPNLTTEEKRDLKELMISRQIVLIIHEGE